MDQHLKIKVPEKQRIKCNWDTEQNPKVINTQQQILSIALSPNRQHIATACANKIKTWDLNSGKQIGQAIEERESSIYAIKYSPCSKYIIATNLDQTIKWWSAITYKLFGKPCLGIDNHQHRIETSFDQKYVLSSSKVKTIRVRNNQTGKEYIDKRIIFGKEMTRMALSPNKHQIVFSNRIGQLNMWNYNRHKCYRKLIGDISALIYSIRYSDDGKFIITTSFHTIAIWNTETGEKIGNDFNDFQESFIYSAHFSPDMQYVISGGHDIIHIWDRYTGKQIGNNYRGKLKWKQVTFDRKYIITGRENTPQIKITKTGLI